MTLPEIERSRTQRWSMLRPLRHQRGIALPVMMIILLVMLIGA